MAQILLKQPRTNNATINMRIQLSEVERDAVENTKVEGETLSERMSNLTMQLLDAWFKTQTPAKAKK